MFLKANVSPKLEATETQMTRIVSPGFFLNEFCCRRQMQTRVAPYELPVREGCFRHKMKSFFRRGSRQQPRTKKASRWPGLTCVAWCDVCGLVWLFSFATNTKSTHSHSYLVLEKCSDSYLPLFDLWPGQL
jgi:hypothetical protein